MRRFLLFITAILLSQCLSAQILRPVKWAYAAKRLSKSEAMLLFKTSIDDDWHIYTTHQQDGGPSKTAFTFTSSNGYKLMGTVQEPPPISHFEQAFGTNVEYFEQSVIFQQKVRLTVPITTIQGKISFMVCNDQKCLPPDDVSFNIPVK